MFQPPGYMENVSVNLSEVLADIGLNERTVMKRRKTNLLFESLHTTLLQLCDENIKVYLFGSQSEGTTTLGLESDYDYFFCLDGYNVIQDMSDWKPGMINYFMINDKTGYCLLQRMRDGIPLPSNYAPNIYNAIDRRGRVLLNISLSRECINGPAQSVKGRPELIDTDIVLAFPCKTWPMQARQWIERQGAGRWPSIEMKRYCSRSGCFIVAVGSKESANEGLEWRISTSLAERCLMLNLNITQLRCYVLMKMILKDFINPLYRGIISSFMCKCILFHCIDQTHASSVWRENRLLECLSVCLDALYYCISHENCPHIFIPENNLMRGRISLAAKHYILDILRKIIKSKGRALLEIECDSLGARLQFKLMHIGSYVPFSTNDITSGHLILKTSQFVNEFLKVYLKKLSQSSCQVVIPTQRKHILYFVTNFNQSQGLDKKAYCLLVPWLCSILGSTLASLNIQQNNAISEEAFTWISVGLNTDVASNKLKLASMLYCTGDTRRADAVLMDVERKYESSFVEPICNCCEHIMSLTRSGFNVMCDNHNEEAICFTTAFCVRFLPCEIKCVPTELQHEMFRSTQEDLAWTTDEDDFWMDWAVVDSLPYLYFLQYKTFRRLDKPDKKRVALSNLVRTIDQEPNLGHRETALNLLGQCMEQEYRARDALQCYLLSLSLRERNNAAKLHICILLSNMINNQ